MLLIAILLGAQWVSRPELAAQALPIEATLVTQAPVGRRTNAAPAPAPAAIETAPPKAKPEPQPTPAPAAKPQPAKPPAIAQQKAQTVVTSRPAPKAVATPLAPPPASAKPKAVAPAASAAAAPAPAADPDKARREAELRARLAAEEHADALRASGAMTAWTQNIRGKVERAWLRPPSVTAALDCSVRVTQVPGGEVVRVEIQACNGDASARESIEAAVYRASPLPQPVDAALFERIIEFRFHPTE